MNKKEAVLEYFKRITFWSILGVIVGFITFVVKRHKFGEDFSWVGIDSAVITGFLCVLIFFGIPHEWENYKRIRSQIKSDHKNNQQLK